MAVIFAQKLVTACDDRKIEYRKVNDHIHFFEFYTQAFWCGINQDLFWARVDDDLIQLMIEQVKEIAQHAYNGNAKKPVALLKR